jgi:hypothetical protein
MDDAALKSGIRALTLGARKRSRENSGTRAISKYQWFYRIIFRILSGEGKKFPPNWK